MLQVGFELVEVIAAAEGISMSSVSFKASFGKGMHVCLGIHSELGNMDLQ